MKRYFVFITLFTVTASFSQLPKTIYKTIGDKTVYDIESKNVFIVSAGLMIDADGSPRAYHEDSKKALDYLGNAGKPGNWWALATDNKKRDGNPVVQSSADPAPGYYVSMTALQNDAKKYEDPNRYVNAETIPFIVIPPNFSKDFRLGDIALVINTKNNKQCFAIFADVGPNNKIGEGSVYLAQQLGIKSNPKNGGTSSGITFILIKHSGQNRVLSNEKIQELGKSKLTDADIAEILK